MLVKYNNMHHYLSRTATYLTGDCGARGKCYSSLEGILASHSGEADPYHFEYSTFPLSRMQSSWAVLFRLPDVALQREGSDMLRKTEFVARKPRLATP
jgi:hypothetical protein